MKSTIETKIKGFTNKIRHWGAKISSNLENYIFLVENIHS